MTYIIVEPCVGLKDSACVDVCPVDCIYTRDQDDMYYISPDECIDFPRDCQSHTYFASVPSGSSSANLPMRSWIDRAILRNSGLPERTYASLGTRRPNLDLAAKLVQTTLSASNIHNGYYVGHSLSTRAFIGEQHGTSGNGTSEAVCASKTSRWVTRPTGAIRRC